jgi:hypothetical protein
MFSNLVVHPTLTRLIELKGVGFWNYWHHGSNFFSFKFCDLAKLTIKNMKGKNYIYIYILPTWTIQRNLAIKKKKSILSFVKKFPKKSMNTSKNKIKFHMKIIFTM